MSAREPVTVKAHAKINVFLRVLGRRPDGFHDLETLLVPLDLHDVVTAAPGRGVSRSRSRARSVRRSLPARRTS